MRKRNNKKTPCERESEQTRDATEKLLHRAIQARQVIIIGS